MPLQQARCTGHRQWPRDRRAAVAAADSYQCSHSSSSTSSSPNSVKITSVMASWARCLAGELQAAHQNTSTTAPNPAAPPICDAASRSNRAEADIWSYLSGSNYRHHPLSQQLACLLSVSSEGVPLRYLDCVFVLLVQCAAAAATKGRAEAPRRQPRRGAGGEGSGAAITRVHKHNSSTPQACQ